MSGHRPRLDSLTQIGWTRRRLMRDGVSVACLGVLAACGCVPSVEKIPRVGFVSPATADREQFLQALRGIGRVEGQSMTFDWRTADEAAPQLTPVVEELVRRPADVIATAGTITTQVAKGATRTIPIVFFGVGDPVAVGLVASLARPEGNVTGVTNIAPQAVGKGLEYLLKLAPRVARVAFVGNLAGNPGSLLQLAAAQSAAATIGVQIMAFGVRDAGDIDRVFGSFSAVGVNAVMVGSDAITINNRPRLVELARQYRLPAIYSRREFADAGGLIALGPNYAALWVRLAVLVDKIIRGRVPGDLPVEQPTDTDLVVNATTAQALGITIPQAILVQAEVVK